MYVSQSLYIDLLRWIVAPQVRGGWQQNHQTKTRQADHANEQLSIVS